MNGEAMLTYICQRCGRKVYTTNLDVEPTCCGGFMSYAGEEKQHDNS